MLTSSDGYVISAPPFHALFSLAFLSFSTDAKAIELGVADFGDCWCTERVFTPEVYLGPAFRSLAPPSLG
jgi:hypothetical protein